MAYELLGWHDKGDQELVLFHGNRFALNNPPEPTQRPDYMDGINKYFAGQDAKDAKDAAERTAATMVLKMAVVAIGDMSD